MGGVEGDQLMAEVLEDDDPYYTPPSDGGEGPGGLEHEGGDQEARSSRPGAMWKTFRAVFDRIAPRPPAQNNMPGTGVDVIPTGS
jgi:hypothetical protein